MKVSLMDYLKAVWSAERLEYRLGSSMAYSRAVSSVVSSAAVKDAATVAR